MDSKGSQIISALAVELSDRKVPDDEIKLVKSAIRDLYDRQVGKGSSCNAQVAFSVSGKPGSRAHLWIHVSWRGLHTVRHGEVMAELVRVFEQVLGRKRLLHVMPHIEFVSASASKDGTELAEFISSLSRDEGLTFCGIWPARQLVRLAS